MNITTLGIDITRPVSQLHGTDDHGKVTLRKRSRRNQLLRFMQQLPPGLVGMEACAGAHFWAKKFQSYGYTVKLIAPQYAFCDIKVVWQQDIQALHRVRSRLMQSRTTLANQIRGLLQEYGVVFPRKISQLGNK